MAQKKKKKKLNVKRLLVFILFIYLLISGIIKLVNEPIKNIIITGNELVSDKEIIERANIKDYPPMISLKINKMKKSIKENPLVSEVEIKRNLKFQVEINVTELKIICLDKNNNKLLLEDGTSIDNNNLYAGIPVLINYTKEDVLKRFLESMGELDYGTLSGISEIEYSPSMSADEKVVDETRFLLKMNDGNSVYINLSKLSTLKYYQKIYANLGDKKGVLHLDSGEYLEVK
mgnify:CR=1 FL=1